MAELISVGVRAVARQSSPWVRRAGLSAIGLWLAWFTGVNLILASHLIPWAINTHNPIVVMDYQRAWTFWPGTVHLEGYWIRGRDREHLEFSFTTGTAFAVVDLPALLHRTFLATRVDVDGLDTRFRVKFDPSESALARAEDPFLPPISGFGDPPMEQLGPEAPPVDDAHFANWTADLEDVRITHLSQVWVQQMRATVRGSAAGRFRIRPERAFNLELSKVEFSSGALEVRSVPVLEGLQVALTGKVDELDPREIHGWGFMDFISASAEVTGVTCSLDFLRGAFPDLAIRGGGGPLKLSAAVDHGVLTEPTRVVADLSPLTLENDALALRGSLHLDARVEKSAIGRTGTLNAELRTPSLSLRASRGAALAAPSLRIKVSSAHLNLKDPFGAAEVVIDSDHITGQLEPWLADLPPAFTVASGEVELRTHFLFRLPLEQGEGEVHLKSGWAVAHVEGHPVSAAIELNVKVDRFDLRGRTMELAGSDLSLVTGTAPDLDRRVEGWWLKAQVERGSLNLSRSANLDAEVRAQARDGRPILDFLAERGTLPYVLTRVLTLPNLEGHAKAHLAERSLTISPVEIVSGQTKVLATTTIDENVEATLMVYSGLVSMGLVVAHHQVTAHPFGGEAILDQALKRAALR